jgi:hypothetical protein
MSILTDFETRVEEVKLYFDFANQLDKVESHKQSKFQLNQDVELTIKRDLQKIIRANCFLILYNLVESTIRSCIWNVYDAISDNKVKFEELSENLSNIWLNQQALDISDISNINKTKEKLKSLISFDSKPVEFSKTRVSLSGNLDYRSIEKIIKDYGFHGRITVSDTRKLGRALLKVKSERNALAHGNKSFRQTAEVVTIQELTEYKELIVTYLRDITKNVESFTENGKYKK